MQEVHIDVAKESWLRPAAESLIVPFLTTNSPIKSPRQLLHTSTATDTVPKGPSPLLTLLLELWRCSLPRPSQTRLLESITLSYYSSSGLGYAFDHVVRVEALPAVYPLSTPVRD
jgi:hypothetical protein